MLSSSATDSTQGVTLTSICSLDNLQDFKLDPPRTTAVKKQTASVLISSFLPDSSADAPVLYMVDSVQLLQQSEVEGVKVALKHLLFLTVLARHMSSRKTTSPLPTNEESPAKTFRMSVGLWRTSYGSLSAGFLPYW